MSQNDSDHPETPARGSLERRLAAVERALADDEPLERADRLDDLEGPASPNSRRSTTCLD